MDKCIMCRSDNLNTDKYIDSDGIECNDCGYSFRDGNSAIISDNEYALILNRWSEYKSSNKNITDNDKWDFCDDMATDLGGNYSQTYGDDYSWNPKIEYKSIMSIITRFDREDKQQ